MTFCAFVGQDIKASTYENDWFDLFKHMDLMQVDESFHWGTSPKSNFLLDSQLKNPPFSTGSSSSYEPLAVTMGLLIGQEFLTGRPSTPIRLFRVPWEEVSKCVKTWNQW